MRIISHLRGDGLSFNKMLCGAFEAHARGGIVRTEHIIENKEGDENNRLEPI